LFGKDLLQIDLAKSAYWISQLKVSISLTPNLQKFDPIHLCSLSPNARRTVQCRLFEVLTG